MRKLLVGMRSDLPLGEQRTSQAQQDQRTPPAQVPFYPPGQVPPYPSGQAPPYPPPGFPAEYRAPERHDLQPPHAIGEAPAVYGSQYGTAHASSGYAPASPAMYPSPNPLMQEPNGTRAA